VKGTLWLSVFAAASLSGAFTEIGKDFERAHPGAQVRFNFAGTPQLVAQVEQGATPDVFASADDRWMKHLEDAGRLAAPPATFARNRLVVIVPRTNPARIARLQDLARPGVKVVLGAETVPVGRYGREVLAKLAATPGFGADYARRVLANVVSQEENVKAVVGKVQLGEADAGLCYRSDVSAAVARYVRVFEVPEAVNVIASYPIAVLGASAQPDMARAFVAHVLSPEGQRVLARHGLVPVESREP